MLRKRTMEEGKCQQNNQPRKAVAIEHMALSMVANAQNMANEPQHHIHQMPTHKFKRKAPNGFARMAWREKKGGGEPGLRSLGL